MPAEPPERETRQRIRFGILGPLEVLRADRRIPVPAAKQRIALATLLLHADKHVASDQLIAYMWPSRPPKNARGALHTHLTRLRQVLRTGGDGEQLIHTEQHGYLIRVDAGDLDLTRFGSLVHRADEAARTPDDDTEVSLLRAALALWRGPALADVPSEALQHDHAGYLAEQRLHCVERWAELCLGAGRHEDVITELAGATATHPLRERLWAQLMLALYRCGRQAEALQAYHTVARLLSGELGVDPGDDLRGLYQSILVADPDLTLPRTDSAATTAPERFRMTPRQLPTDIAAFVGRVDHLATLDRLLRPADADGSARPVRIAAITGTAGVGKTALAVHWGHRVRQRFPDGQLYVDLRGYGPDDAVEPAAALETLLLGLEVPVERIPADADARSALLRSVLAHRRVLLVLDNARDVAQVRPLLPGSDAVVLITSRDQLRSLSMHGDACHVTLGVLSAEESAALLSAVLGVSRTRAEPQPTTELADLCAHLPLALRIAVANLALDHYPSIAGYVAELRAGNRLAALRIAGDQQTAIRGTLDLSYATLPSSTRAVFRLLGLVPGPDFTPAAAAALGGIPAEEARTELDRLATAHLIHRYAPDRYRFHDLLRLYAAERAGAEDVPDALEGARQRLYDWYLLSARAGVERSHPHWARLPAAANPTSVTPASFADLAPAADWLATEHDNLVAAVQQAVRHGPRPSVWLLTDTLRSHFWASGRVSDWLSCAQVAVTVAREGGDARGTAAALLALADVYSFQERPDSGSLYAEALAVADTGRWTAGMSSIRNNLAGNHLRLGQLEDAARCFREGIALDEQDGRLAWLGVKRVNLAAVYVQLGRLEAAFVNLTGAIRFHADNDGIIAINFGEVCYLQGRFDDARRHLEGARRRLTEAGNHAIEPYCLVLLADLHSDLGHHHEALTLGERALACSRDVRDRLAEALALTALGKICTSRGDRTQAIGLHRRAVELAGSDHLFARAAGLIGMVSAAQGSDDAEAASCAEQALAITRERSFRLLEGQALTALARMAQVSGDSTRAVREAELALRIHRTTGHRLGEARTLRLLSETAPAAPALAYGEEAARLFTELGLATSSATARAAPTDPSAPG